MTYYAQLVDDIVVDVIVVSDNVPDGAQFCHDTFGGLWVQTFIDDPDKTYAGVGYTYDAATNNFIAPPPIPDPT
jgi:hypothetical protein